MDQAENLALRTDRSLLMKPFGPSPYDFPDALYALQADPDELNYLDGVWPTQRSSPN